MQFWGIMSVVRDQAASQGERKVNSQASVETSLLENPEIILDKPTNTSQAKHLPLYTRSLERQQVAALEHGKAFKPLQGWGSVSCRAKTLIPMELHCNPSTAWLWGEKKR